MGSHSNQIKRVKFHYFSEMYIYNKSYLIPVVLFYSRNIYVLLDEIFRIRNEGKELSSGLQL